MVPDSWLKERLQTSDVQELSKRELIRLGFQIQFSVSWLPEVRHRNGLKSGERLSAKWAQETSCGFLRVPLRHGLESRAWLAMRLCVQDASLTLLRPARVRDLNTLPSNNIASVNVPVAPCCMLGSVVGASVSSSIRKDPGA
jgi:hypothetical protein